jgi:hypothetical protein
MLAHFDGANAANNSTFVDSSANNLAVTAHGVVSQGAFGPAVGMNSGYFNGSTDYVQSATSAQLNLSSGNWTMEAWAYPTVGANWQTVMMNGLTNTDGHGITQYNNGHWLYNINGGSFIDGGAIVLNTWVHLAAVRNSGVTTFYVNGVAMGTTTNAPTNKSYPMVIGAKGNPAEYFNGYLSQVRVVTGTAVYTSNFTPAQVPLTAITGTQFFEKFANGAIVDAVSKAEFTQPFGAPALSTARAKFGTASLSLNGSSKVDALDVPASTFTGTDWTIEGWTYIPSSGSHVNNTLMHTYPYFTVAISMNRNGSGSTSVYIGNGSTWPVPNISSSANLSFDTWNHIAVVKHAGVLTLYHNGVSVGTSTTMPTGFTGGVSIGCLTNNTECFTGNADELRISNIARYTSNFTVPTAPFPNQ